ncbi:cytochrome B [Crocinitomix algicola]|uniref:cytochrome B n=1 Tax=Crocinitomix algicola TaxID=1740263 RepID=UPI0008365E7E|nr:cytochrome B [Crocinitomix algicola]
MDTFGRILQSSHSGWRWIVLVLLITAVVKAHLGWKQNKNFKPSDKKLALFAMIAFHIQFLFGWVLYFFSPKVAFIAETMSIKILRFFTVEHSLIMTIAMVLITIGHSKSKKKETDTQKFRMIAIFYTLALILVLAGIPWPFRTDLAAGWF